MRVLVACEESQTVCSAFLRHGDDAFSCDIQPSSGNYPHRHILGDVIQHLNSVPHFYYDIIIAHPPCTYLSAVGSLHFKRDPSRHILQSAAREFFMFFYNYPYCKHICIENPRPRKDSNLPPYNQIIQPYDFGDNYSKQTMLWLKGLPPLFPNVIELNRRSAAPSWVALNHGSKNRSKFFTGIANAMAQQWRY